MKRLLCILLTLLLLTGCTAPPAEPPLPSETTRPTETTAPAETVPAAVSEQVLALRASLPVMDGSTSLIPLEAGVRAAIFGITMEEATAQVAHSSTWSSFHNLLAGEAELIFSCPLSAEQRNIAIEQGVTLETVPVAMEGFLSGVRIPMDKLPDGTLVTEAPRDFGGTIDHENILVHKNWRISDRDSRYAYNADGLVSCGFLKEELHPNAAKINGEVMDYLNTYFTRNAILSYYSQFGVGEDSLDIWMLDWDLYDLGGKYLLFQGGAPYHMTENEEDRIVYPHIPCLLYDLETGEEVAWTVLLMDDWRDAVPTARRYPGAVDVPLPDVQFKLRSLYPQQDGTLDITLRDGTVEYAISLPSDYVNYG